MSIPNPPDRWSLSYGAALKSSIESKDRANRKTGVDIELVKERLILRSPNGTRYALVISNAGVLSTVPA